MLIFEVDRIFLQQLEYEMGCTEYLVDYNCFEIGYCGHPDSPYANNQFKQATNVIHSHFQEEYHMFIHDTLKNKKYTIVLLIFCLQT